MCVRARACVCVCVHADACPCVYITLLRLKFIILFCFFNRRRLNIRITELEDTCEQLRVRNGTLEKAKAKLTNEIKEITIELENVSHTDICHDVSV